MPKLLNYKNQNLTSFPSEILAHKGITNLNLEGNSIREIPEWIRELKSLKVLYLSFNEISDFSSLCGLTNLEVLHLNNNKVTEIPPEMSNLKNLKRLYLNNNLITEVKATVGTLTELIQLLLAKNQINVISDEVSKLEKLEVLNLFDNQLTKLPNSIGQLGQLEYLQISKNKIAELPESIGLLMRLTSLELFSNKLVNLNEEIKELPLLINLNIADNNIETISNIPNSVIKLSIYNNPIIHIEYSVLNKFQGVENDDHSSFLFIDSNQSNDFDIKKLIYGKSLKIVDIINKQINPYDLFLIPVDLREKWELKRSKLSNVERIT